MWMNLKSLLVILLGFFTVVANAQLRINEVMSGGNDFFPSENGDFYDWVEFYNAGDERINLKGYFLSDDPLVPEKWKFPAVSVESGEFLVVFLSGNSKKKIKGECHASFRLNSRGEGLILSNPDLEVLDRFPVFSDAGKHTIGRVFESAEEFEVLTSPTPGESNTAAPGILFSHASGIYPETVKLTMNTAPGGVIYYTLDGSNPSPDDYKYMGPLNLNKDQVMDLQLSKKLVSKEARQKPRGDVFKGHIIKAAVFKGSEQISRTFVRSIFIDSLGSKRYEGWGVISLVCDTNDLFNFKTGIYVPGESYKKSKGRVGNFTKRGREWERNAHITYINEDGHIALNQHIGIRIHGGSSREHLQKSFRLYAREDYGLSRFNSCIFHKDTVFTGNRLVLRNTMSCRHHSLIKDELTMEICRDLKFEKLDYKGVILMVNGEYWGIYNLRPYFDEGYVESKYGYDKDSVNIVLNGAGFRPTFSSDWGVISGDGAYYKRFYQFLRGNSFDDPDNYAQLCTKLNIENTIDYYCAEIFFNNQDWPSNNKKLWCYGESGKWNHVFYDMDASWIAPEHDIISGLLNPKGTKHKAPFATLFFRKLMESDEFRKSMAMRMAELLENEFSTENINATIDRFEKKYINMVEEHVERWNFVPRSKNGWLNTLKTLKRFAETRSSSIKKHFVKAFPEYASYFQE